MLHPWLTIVTCCFVTQMPLVQGTEDLPEAPYPAAMQQSSVFIQFLPQASRHRYGRNAPQDRDARLKT